MPDKLEMLLERIKPEEEVNWKVVQDIVEGYAERFPEELTGCVAYVKQLRSASNGSYALMSKDTEMRHLYEIPERLTRGLTMKYPKVLSGKNLRQFLKLYPIFQVAEKL